MYCINNSHIRLAVCALAIVTTIGCDVEPDESAAQGENTSLSSETLQLGASGVEVRAVREQLTHIGYFPNDLLAKKFPNWVPAVPVTSANPVLRRESGAGSWEIFRPTIVSR